MKTILRKRVQLYDHLSKVLNEAIDTWGTRMNSFEFTDIDRTGYV